MLLALSGTHMSGKTTLAERLTRFLAAYTIIDEPYYLLESQAHHFSDPPTTEDYELQLACSLDTIEAATANCIFDRSPIDFLAYLLAGRGHAAVDFDRWIPRVRHALGRLDLIVYVPLEEPDRMRDIPVERPSLCRRMDERLRELLQ